MVQCYYELDNNVNSVLASFSPCNGTESATGFYSCGQDSTSVEGSPSARSVILSRSPLRGET
jgi:hypothetical protein